MNHTPIFLIAVLCLLVYSVSAGGFTEHDIGLDPGYTLTLEIKDASSTALIFDTVTIVTTGSDSNTYTTTTGSVTIPTAYGIVYVTASCGGYAPASDSWLMDADRNETIYLGSEGNATPSQVLYATPHDVKFIVRTLLGYPVMNATVNATYMESSGPLAWLMSWFGVPSSVDVQNVTMSGHTGLDGAIVFSMVPTVKYDVEVWSDAGNASLHQFYPQDTEYTIWLGGNLTGNLSGASFYTHGASLTKNIIYTGNFSETSAITGTIGVTYIDLLNSTVQCYVTVNQSHSYGNYTNETTVDVYGYTPAGTSNFSHIFNINNQRDQSYLLHLMCNHTLFGNFTRDLGVQFPPGPVSFGIPEELLVYVGMGGLFFIALCFTRTLPGPAAIVVMFFAWIFYFLRWWRELAPDLIVIAALVTFSAVAVMFNIMLRSKKLVYE